MFVFRLPQDTALGPLNTHGVRTASTIGGSKVAKPFYLNGLANVQDRDLRCAPNRLIYAVWWTLAVFVVWRPRRCSPDATHTSVLWTLMIAFVRSFWNVARSFKNKDLSTYALIYAAPRLPTTRFRRTSCDATFAIKTYVNMNIPCFASTQQQSFVLLS